MNVETFLKKTRTYRAKKQKNVIEDTISIGYIIFIFVKNRMIVLSRIQKQSKNRKILPIGKRKTVFSSSKNRSREQRGFRFTWFRRGDRPHPLNQVKYIHAHLTLHQSLPYKSGYPDVHPGHAPTLQELLTGTQT